MKEDNQALIGQPDLAAEDLGNILGASCESYRLCVEYFKKILKLDIDCLLDGLSIELNDIYNPKNWMYANDIRQFKLNFIRNTGMLFSHRQWYKVGKEITTFKNSLLLLLGKMMSEEQILYQMTRIAKKYNNEFLIKPLPQKRGDFLLVIEDYPYFKKHSPGSECWLTIGFFAANFNFHNIIDYRIDHLLCGKKFFSIKTDLRYASIPVIIITADVTEAARQELAAKKCDAYLLKPVSKHTLVNALKQFLPHNVVQVAELVERPPTVPEVPIPDYMDSRMARHISDALTSLKDEKWADLEKTMIISDERSRCFDKNRQKNNLLIA